MDGFNDLSRSQLAFLPDRFYQRATRVTLDARREFTLKTGPKFAHISACSYELNLQQWGCFSRFISDLKRFSDPEFLKIKRIDHAVDISMPVFKVHQGLRVRSKGEHDQYDEPSIRKRCKRALLTGFYIGEKPEKFCIYDKGYELLKTVERLKRNPGTDLGVCTRIELRQFGKSVPFSRLLDLPNYVEANLFNSIEFYEFPEEMKTQRGEEFKTAAIHKGFHVAFCEFNEGNNLKRTIIKQLTEVPLSDQLHEFHREKLRSFIDSESKVEKVERSLNA